MNNMTTRRDIRSLSDEMLVKAIDDLDGRKLNLTKWELAFVARLAAVWIRFGSITWKQRRAARELLEKLIARAARAGRMTE